MGMKGGALTRGKGKESGKVGQQKHPVLCQPFLLMLTNITKVIYQTIHMAPESLVSSLKLCVLRTNMFSMTKHIPFEWQRPGKIHQSVILS